MIKVDVLVANKSWKKYITNPDVYLKNRLKKAELKIGILKNNKLNFTLLLSGDSEIKKLNNIDDKYSTKIETRKRTKIVKNIIYSPKQNAHESNTWGSDKLL